MKTTKPNKWDAAEFLDNEELIAGYLEDAFASGDLRIINKTVSNVVRARNMTKLAKDIGVNRESLYKSLSEDGNPSFSTMLKIVDNLGLRLITIAKDPANEDFAGTTNHELMQA
jgi:probable addiction module antidote protein